MGKGVSFTGQQYGLNPVKPHAMIIYNFKVNDNHIVCGNCGHDHFFSDYNGLDDFDHQTVKMIFCKCESVHEA